MRNWILVRWYQNRLVFLVEGIRNTQDETGISIGSTQIFFGSKTHRFKSCLLLLSFMTQFLHRIIVRIKEDLTENKIGAPSFHYNQHSSYSIICLLILYVSCWTSHSCKKALRKHQCLGWCLTGHRLTQLVKQELCWN